MEGSGINVRYKKGENQELDRRFEKFKKLRIWSGTSYCEALSNEEIDRMIQIWKKDTLKPQELTVNDVLTLMVWLLFEE